MRLPIFLHFPRVPLKTSQFCVLFGLLFGSLSSTIAQPSLDLLNTQAAQAFKDGDFDQAVIEFRSLSEQYPEDTTVLRYFAISLSKSGAYGDAIDVFRKILERTSDQVAVHFHLAVTLYKANFSEEAEQWFLSAINLAQESRYAEIAREYLDAISVQRKKAQRPGQPQRWGFFAQLGAKYNNNVPLN